MVCGVCVGVCVCVCAHRKLNRVNYAVFLPSKPVERECNILIWSRSSLNSYKRTGYVKYPGPGFWIIASL